MMKLRFRMKDFRLQRFGFDLMQNSLVLSKFAVFKFF